jgi:hypothetical protein
LATIGEVTKAERLLALADQKAREVQLQRDGQEYGITSSQMQGLILALGEFLDQYEALMAKYMLELARKAFR